MKLVKIEIKQTIQRKGRVEHRKSFALISSQFAFKKNQAADQYVSMLKIRKFHHHVRIAIVLYHLQIVAILTLTIVVRAADKKCWNKDCDNKLRDCAKEVVNCFDKCHHGCKHDENLCENGLHAKYHQQNPPVAIPHSERIACHDTNYKCIITECPKKCSVSGSNPELPACARAGGRKCFTNCDHTHTSRDEIRLD